MRVVLIAFTNIEYTIELAEALHRRVEVFLMIPAEDVDRFQEVIEPGLAVIGFRKPRLREVKNVGFVLRFVRRIRALEPDIVHIQRGHPWFNLALPLLHRYCIVTTIHDVSLHTGDKESSAVPWFFHRLAINSARRVIVHGERLKEEMVSKYRKGAGDIDILRRGTNSIYTRYATGAVEEEEGAILFFGRIWDYKGLRYLIEAEPFVSLRIPHSKIIIAGRGDEMGKYLSLMKNRERFEIHNERIGNAKVAELFQRASVVVLPYTDASQSGVVPLAYAFGKPVIVTDVGSLPEVVEHGETGYVVPARDAARLAEAIAVLLGNGRERRRMGDRAYAKSKRELSWDGIAAGTVQVYGRALAMR